MGIGVSRALDWDLAAVEAQSMTLANDSASAAEVGGELRSDGERTLDEMSGYTIDAARETIADTVRRTFTLADNLERSSALLSNFAANAAVQQARLRSEVRSATTAGYTVTEEGAVVPADGTDVPADGECAEWELAIQNALRALVELDTETADKLTGLHGSIADYGNNSDPSTTIAGAVISAVLNPLGDLIGDDGLRSTRVIARGLGPFGSLLGFAAGIAGAPDDEPMSETLAAEGAGLAAGVATGMAAGATTGAAVGSIVPVAGTAIGGIAGIVVGGFMGFKTSEGVRDHFDDQQAGE